MDVNALEAGPVKSSRHLHLAVHSLFAKDRHRRTAFRHGNVPARNPGRIVGGVELQAGVVGVQQVFVLLARAIGVVPQGLHPVRQLGPCALQDKQVGTEHLAAAGLNTKSVIAPRPPQHNTHVSCAVRIDNVANRVQLVVRHLENSACLLRTQRGKNVGRMTEVHVRTHPSPEHHLGQRHKQAAIGAVVIRLQKPPAHKRLDRGEHLHHISGIVNIGANVANLVEHLGQRRTAKPVSALSRVQEKQRRRTRFQVGRDGPAHVPHRRKCAHNKA